MCPPIFVTNSAVIPAKIRNLAAQVLALKTNPPYPPLTGGQEKAKPLSPVGANRLFLPPCQGGVGGVGFIP